MRTERPTVLVVDDERDLADTFAAWLSADSDVRTAYDGATALDRYDADVDVALLDRRLPDRSGDDVLARIRERGGDCQVAMVTAVQPDVDVFDLGFDDYVVKPVAADELRSLVDRLVRRAEYDDRIQRHYALASKLAALERYNAPAALEASAEYRHLQAELERIQDEFDETVAGFEHEDFTALLRRQVSRHAP